MPSSQPITDGPTSPSLDPSTGTGATGGGLVSAPPSGDTIRIGSFNIQVFGTSKLAKAPVMKILTQVIRQFEIVAIQEVRSVDDNVLPTFVNMINADGYRYDFVIGPRLGRTNSKEQYAFIFNTERIEVDRANVYTVDDPQDLLHREPLVARFRVRGVPPEQAFTFSLVDIHTDPGETRTELDALGEVFVAVQNDGSGEDDVIILGDLNVDEKHLGALGRIQNITYAIAGIPTNTRRSKTYDNLVFDRVRTAEYTQHSGVMDLRNTFSISESEALQVSDHCPVWAEFSVYEAGTTPYVSGRPNQRPR